MLRVKAQLFYDLKNVTTWLLIYFASDSLGRLLSQTPENIPKKKFSPI